jgi:uncharacterized membrane protein YdjX (TVP38/TMEM64 family)
VWAPLVFIAISFLQVTFIPIPGAVTILAGSYLFGAWLSYLYSYIGFMLGSIVAFWLGKKIGRPFVNWVFGSKEEVDSYLARLKGKEKVCLFFMFLLPMFPDDALCAIAGILPISWTEFLIMQIITRATSIAGTLFFMSGEIIPFHGWGLVVIGLVAVLAIVAFIICYKNAEKLNAAFDKSMTKLASLFKIKRQKGNPASAGKGQTGQTELTELTEPDQSEPTELTDQSEPTEDTEQTELTEIAEITEVAEQPQPTEQTEKAEQIGQTGITEQPKQTEKAELTEQSEQTEKINQSEQTENTEPKDPGA